MKGRVVKFDFAKGFGFIRSKHHEKDIFVHVSKVHNADKLFPGQSVEYEIESTPKGFAAISVIAGRKQKSPYFIYGSISAILVFGVAFYLAQQMQPILAYFVAVNLATLVMYGYDKAIAGSEKLRVPEWMLHGLAILGGSPAALLSQMLFRHKTIKGSFQLIYWLIVFVQGVVIGAISNA